MIVHPCLAGDAIVELDLHGRTVDLWIVVAVTLTHAGTRIDRVRRAGSSRSVEPTFKAWRWPVSDRRYRETPP